MPDETPAPTDAADGGESLDDIIGDLTGQIAEERSKPPSGKGESKEPKGADEPEGAEAASEPKDDPGESAGDNEQDDGEAGHESKFSSVEELRSAIDKAIAAGDLKKAFMLAFRKMPEAFQINEAKIVAFRKQEQRERQKTKAAAAAVLTDRQNLNNEVQAAIQRLSPYEKYYQAEQAFLATGDTAKVRELVTQLMRAPNYSEAQKRLLHDDKRSPAEMRMQAELADLKAQLEREKQQAQQTTTQREAERQRQADLAHIAKTLAGHDVAKIPKYAERVYRVLEKHFDPRLGGLQITVEEAAARVVRGERKRVESSPFYQKPAATAGTAPAPARGKAPVRAPLRRDSQNNGAASGSESIEDIIADVKGQIERQKMQNAKGKRAS